MNNDNILEAGEASITVGLVGGVVTVKHGFSSETLFTGDCPAGGWDNIIKSILKACPNGKGFMVDEMES